MIDPHRYITFKRDDLLDALNAIPSGVPFSNEYLSNTIHFLMRRELEDAVVIRTKDLFAGPALHTYVNNILSVLELITHMHDHGIPDDTIKHLRDLADYFAGEATIADQYPEKRFPD